MAANGSSFHDYVVRDLLAGLPGITSKRMFGGWGLYKAGVIFGIIVNGELYFKVDESNQKEYEVLGSRPFVYTKKAGKPVSMSYWFVPGAVLENRPKLYAWVEQSVACQTKG